ncbi:hypothetical protein BgiMline_000810 [Biomphalaria glabrata]
MKSVPLEVTMNIARSLVHADLMKSVPLEVTMTRARSLVHADLMKSVPLEVTITRARSLVHAKDVHRTMVCLLREMGRYSGKKDECLESHWSTRVISASNEMFFDICVP